MVKTLEIQEWGVPDEFSPLTDVLLCRPDHFRWLPTSSISKATLQRGYRFDPELARRQHDEMVAAYDAAGVRCHFLTPDPYLPYQVFTRDSSFMTPYGAVVCQPYQSWRRGEYAPVIRFYQDTGIPIYGMVSAGAFEGGDFDIVAEKSVLIGHCGERTEEPAARQVAAWFAEEGWDVHRAPIAPHFVHIDLMVCMLAPQCAAVCKDTTDDDVLDWLTSKNIELINCSYRETMKLGCNVLALGEDRILSTAENRDFNAKLRAAGFTVYDPDVSMFTLGGGGVHCMAMPLRRTAQPAR